MAAAQDMVSQLTASGHQLRTALSSMLLTLLAQLLLVPGNTGISTCHVTSHTCHQVSPNDVDVAAMVCSVQGAIGHPSNRALFLLCTAENEPPPCVCRCRRHGAYFDHIKKRCRVVGGATNSAHQSVAYNVITQDGITNSARESGTIQASKSAGESSSQLAPSVAITSTSSDNSHETEATVKSLSADLYNSLVGYIEHFFTKDTNTTTLHSQAVFRTDSNYSRHKSSKTHNQTNVVLNNTIYINGGLLHQLKPDFSQDSKYAGVRQELSEEGTSGQPTTLIDDGFSTVFVALIVVVLVLLTAVLLISLY